MTTYGEIFNHFLSEAVDFDMKAYKEDTRNALLFSYMNTAQAEFQPICAVDLTDRDDLLWQYNQDLGYEEIHILALGMVWAWYNYRLNRSDNLSNFLSTRDYSLAAAPSNMLKEVRNTRDEAWNAFRSAMVRYSYLHGDIDQLRP